MTFFDPTTLALFVILGSFAGFLAGLLGIGGGIILVPLFLWAFPLAGFSPSIVVHAAFATSLAIIVPTALSSTLAHRRRGNVEWQQVFHLCAGGLAGSVIGASLAAGLSGIWLQGLFGLMQILVGGQMLHRPRYLPPERSEPIPFYQLVSVGLAGGAFSAFFGVGGGVVAVPLMVIALRMPIHFAVGNSSALIVISAFFGALSYTVHGWNHPDLAPFSLGYVNVLVAFLVAPFAMVNARIGVWVAARLHHDKLSKIFAVVLILVGLRMVVRTFS
jgi:uncharacterized protein